MRTINSQGTLNSYVVTPDEIKVGDRFGYKIVAKVWEIPWGSESCWCAYRGLTDWTDQRCEEEGDEIDEEVANQLFPSLAVLGMSYYNP